MSGNDAKQELGEPAGDAAAATLAQLRDAGAHLRGVQAPAALQARLEQAYAARMARGARTAADGAGEGLRAGIRMLATPAARTWATGLAAACSLGALIAFAPWRADHDAAPAAAPVTASAHPAPVPAMRDPQPARTLLPPAGAATRTRTDVAIAHAHESRTAHVVRPTHTAPPDPEPAATATPLTSGALAQALPPLRGEDPVSVSIGGLRAVPSDPSTLRIATTAPPSLRFPGSMPPPPSLEPPPLPTTAPASEPAAPPPSTPPPAQAVSAATARAIAMSSAATDAAARRPIHHAGTASRRAAVLHGTPASPT